MLLASDIHDSKELMYNCALLQDLVLHGCRADRHQPLHRVLPHRVPVIREEGRVGPVGAALPSSHSHRHSMLRFWIILVSIELHCGLLNVLNAQLYYT